MESYLNFNWYLVEIYSTQVLATEQRSLVRTIYIYKINFTKYFLHESTR